MNHNKKIILYKHLPFSVGHDGKSYKNYQQK